LLQLVLEIDKLVEELGVDVFDALNALEVDLCLQIFFWDFLAQLLGAMDALQSFRLL
jgi:hypothetical protein